MIKSVLYCVFFQCFYLYYLMFCKFFLSIYQKHCRKECFSPWNLECLVAFPTPRELILLFLSKHTFSFVPINLHGCWTRDCMCSIDHVAWNLTLQFHKTTSWNLTWSLYSEKGLHANISSQSCSTHKLWGFWCNFTIVCECTVRFNHMKLVTSKLKLYYTSSSCLAASRASSRALALRFSISRACESCLDWK